MYFVFLCYQMSFSIFHFYGITHMLWPGCHNMGVLGVLPRTPVQNRFANSLQTSGASYIPPIRSKPINHAYSQMPLMTSENKMRVWRSFIWAIPCKRATGWLAHDTVIRPWNQSAAFRATGPISGVSGRREAAADGAGGAKIRRESRFSGFPSLPRTTGFFIPSFE